MPVNYAVQAEVVDIRADTPKNPAQPSRKQSSRKGAMAQRNES